MTTKAPKKQIIKFTCSEEEEGKSLVDLIAEKSQLSKSIIKKLMIFGAVKQSYKITKRRIRKAKTLVRSGDIIECYFDPSIDLDQIYEFPVLFHTKHFGVYLKPAGAHTEGTSFGDKTSVFRFVEKQKKFAFLVNRIDQDVEGLVIIAYDSKTQNFLQMMWRDEVIKRYQAVIQGDLKGEGVFSDKINNKFSQTQYYCKKTIDNQTYVEITLKTERKNQIRFHFSKAGFPIIGDTIYNKESQRTEQIKLMSYELSFKNPHTQELVKVTLPEEKRLFIN